MAGALWKTDSTGLRNQNFAPSYGGTDELREVWTLEGGLDTMIHPQFLKSNQTSDEVSTVISGAVSVRNRRARTMVGPVANGKPQLLGVFQNTTLVRAIAGVVQRWDGANWTNILTGLDVNAPISMTNFEYAGARAMLITNGVDAPKFIKADWTTGDLNTVNAPKGKLIMNDTVRVFIAKGDVLSFTARLKGDDWTTPRNSGFIQIFTTQGGDITAMIRALGMRLIFKKDYIGDLHGNNLQEYQVMDVSSQIGCHSSSSLLEIQGVIFWLGYKQIYAFTGGMPTPIGDPVIKYLEKVDWANADKCFAVTDGLNYHIGLNDNTSAYPTVLLSYSPKYKIWRVNRIGEINSYGTLFNNQWYTMDDKGTVFLEGSPNAIPGMTVVSPAFTESFVEQWKEYKELHIQAQLFSGNIQVYCSPTADGNDFMLIDTITQVGGASDNAHIIPLDSFPLTHWFRMKLVVNGDAELYSIERFYGLLPADN